MEQLKRIKLLRKLDIPCEQIRLVTTSEMSLPECVWDQKQKLEMRGHDLSQMQELCIQLAETETDFDSLDASGWLDRMNTLERGGVQLTDTNKLDVKRRKWGAVLSAAVSILFMAAFVYIILWANHEEPIPIGVLIFVILIPVGIIAVIAIALYQRMKELKGGELDEAGKY